MNSGKKLDHRITGGAGINFQAASWSCDHNRCPFRTQCDSLEKLRCVRGNHGKRNIPSVQDYKFVVKAEPPHPCTDFLFLIDSIQEEWRKILHWRHQNDKPASCCNYPELRSKPQWRQKFTTWLVFQNCKNKKGSRNKPVSLSFLSSQPIKPTGLRTTQTLYQLRDS